MQNKTGSGMGLGGTVFVVFLVLKLTNVIAWSWWWVTAPLWAPALVILAVTLLTFITVLIWESIG